jgi:hypothetical protein
MGLDCLFKKILIIAHKNKNKKQTIQPGEAFEDTAFKPWFEIVKFYTRL